MMAVTLASACADSPTGPSDPFSRQVALTVGETARVDEARLSLRFDSVTGDSRCPADALCIQGGDAIVHITVSRSPGQAVRYELHTAGPSSVQHDNVMLTLEALAPYPFSGAPIDPSTYRATIRLTR